jgi:hypothetical protein
MIPLTMENIIQPNESFNFSSISLAHPTGIHGGAYFTKILNTGKPLYIQTPKGLTKQGFVKNGKKIYADLMFDNNDELFIHWLENLETKCQDLIFEKKDSWFENDLDKNDIETAFTSPMRIYKSGKFYLVRVNIKVSNSTNLPSVKIYNESETSLTIDDIANDTSIISILEIQGIKFTSRNFQIEIELKQSMVLNSDALFESCLIKTSAPNKKNNIEGLLSNKPDDLLIKFQPLKSSTPVTNDLDIKMEDIEDLEDLENLDDNKKNSIDFLEQLSIDILNQESKNEAVNKDVNVNESIIVKKNDEEDEDEEDEEEEEEEDEEPRTPLIFGSEIKPSTIIVNTNSVRFNEQSINSLEGLEGLEEVDFDINTNQKNDLGALCSEELREFDVASNLETLGSMKLKKPNQVYYEIYKQARKKAKQSKKEAILAFLEAKNIKKIYMLNDLDESDSDNSDLDNIE